MPTEGSLHWLKVDGLPLGLWRARAGAGGDVVLSPVPFDSVSSEELGLGKTGSINWNVR